MLRKGGACGIYSFVKPWVLVVGVAASRADIAFNRLLGKFRWSCWCSGYVGRRLHSLTQPGSSFPWVRRVPVTWFLLLA